MNTSEPKEPSFITILGRAFTIMEELLKSDKPLGVSELARLTGIPKANTFRIMKTLEELKAVERLRMEQQFYQLFLIQSQLLEKLNF